MGLSETGAAMTDRAAAGAVVPSRPDRPVAVTPMLLVVWCVVAAILLLQGAAALPSGVSTDDAMRLVEVRDFLAGQSWFDLAQYRLEPPDGVVMHWSRLIDLPLALMIAAARPLLGQAGAENLALAAWPLGLLLPTLAGIGRVALRLADARAAALALILAVMTAPVLTHFRVGAIDHHNVQILLLIWTIAVLVREPPGARAAAGAALMSVISLAIGLEMLPAIAVIGAGVALNWLARGREAAPVAIAFGSAFAAAAAALFVATVPPWRYGIASCDAFSVVHLVAAGIAGLGLAGLAALLRTRSAAWRLTGAAALAVVLAVTLRAKFPACLGDPYDYIGPRLAALWLDHVSEARSIVSLARDLPQQIIPVYGFIVVALAAAGLTLAKHPEIRRFPWLLAVGVLAALLGVSLWQVRGAAAADLLAVPLIAASLTTLFPVGRSVLLGLTRPALVGALVLNQATLVPIGAAAARGVEALTGTHTTVLSGGAATCERPADFAPLAALPKGLVLGFIDSGPNILMATEHGVLAAPYRNTAGNNAMLDVLLGTPEEARARLATLGVDYVAFCAGAPERFIYAQAAPDGLAARLGRGEVPDFLLPVATAPTPVSIYRVRR